MSIWLTFQTTDEPACTEARAGLLPARIASVAQRLFGSFWSDAADCAAGRLTGRPALQAGQVDRGIRVDGRPAAQERLDPLGAVRQGPQQRRLLLLVAQPGV